MLSPISPRKWVRRLFERKPQTVRNKPERPRRPFRPGLEQLEDRIVPSTVYFNDFENPSTIGTEWSNTDTSVTPVGSRTFLGDFNNQTVALTLDNLPTHQSVTVSFDLYLLRSWDGNSTQVTEQYGTLGPDVWNLSVNGGPTLLNTTFSNHFDPSISPSSTRQAYPGTFSGGDYAAGTGAAGGSGRSSLTSRGPSSREGVHSVDPSLVKSVGRPPDAIHPSGRVIRKANPVKRKFGK